MRKRKGEVWLGTSSASTQGGNAKSESRNLKSCRRSASGGFQSPVSELASLSEQVRHAGFANPPSSEPNARSPLPSGEAVTACSRVRETLETNRSLNETPERVGSVRRCVGAKQLTVSRLGLHSTPSEWAFFEESGTSHTKRHRLRWNGSWNS